MHQNNTIWDVIVIGGGPAGMIAAGRAGQLGAKVLLLEKNARLGEKLLITGGGRSNITNFELDVRKFLEHFSDRSKFLYSPFSQFGVKETLDFFLTLGMKTKLEAEGRVFPESGKAETVQKTLIEYMKQNSVSVKTNTEVKEMICNKNIIKGVKTKNNESIFCKSIILATGGLSHPETGSTGDGFRFLEKLGQNIQKTDVNLVPVRTKEAWSHQLSGISFDKVKVSILVDGIKSISKTGKILFTHFGLSGPLVLNLSHVIKSALEEGSVELRIDLFPTTDVKTLDQMVQELFHENRNKRVKNSFGALIPSSLAKMLPKILSLDSEKEVNSVTKSERQTIVKWLKEIPLTPTGLLGAGKAIVTSGGVPLNDIDTKTMRSNQFPNLYLIGDILDINRPSGGYSLQLCWTTGWVAGNDAGKTLTLDI